MNALQEQRLANINDRWPVDTWREEKGVVVVECEDGDEAEIHEDGSANWRSVNGRPSSEEIE